MTNFSQSFVLKSLSSIAFAVFLIGCGINPDKEYAKGLKAFENADYHLAAKRFRNVVAESPGNVDALVYLARSEFALANLDAAEKAIVKAAVTNGGDADIVELSAQIAFFKKDYKLATKHYAYLASNPAFDAQTRSKGWAGLGLIDFVMIDIYPEVLRYRHECRVKFLQSIVLDRRNACSRYYLGRLYRDTFHYLEAAKDEFDVFVHLLNGSDSRVKRVKNEILPLLKEEISRSSSISSQVDSPICASFLKQGDDAFRRKNWKSAITAYLKAYKSDSNSFPAAIGLARAYARSNRSNLERSESMRMYLRACKLRPSAIAIYIESAQFALSTGNFATSVELYSRALAANPTSRPAAEGLVLALTKSGDTQAASVYRGYLRTLGKTK